jgi:phenylpropionate dioxygenase-like ring-hydroxylating dioxygenase large terminal subunit
MAQKQRGSQNTDSGRNGMSDDGIFLRNCWYVAAWNHELIDGRKLARTILERPVVIGEHGAGGVECSAAALAPPHVAGA